VCKEVPGSVKSQGVKVRINVRVWVTAPYGYVNAAVRIECLEVRYRTGVLRSTVSDKYSFYVCEEHVVLFSA